MKKNSKKILAVLGLGLVLGMGVQAQNPAISAFPYVADFGTTETHGDNVYWKFKAFNYTDNTPVESAQWHFSALSGGTAMAVHFEGSADNEMCPAAITPKFHLEKAEDVSYLVTVVYEVSDFAKWGVILRLHALEAGEPYFKCEGENDGYTYESEEPVKVGDKIYSTFINTETNIQTGTSYSYRVNANQIPENGDYCFSFIASRQSKKAAKAVANLYIKSLKIEKETGADVAAGQIVSPYTDVQADVQSFSAYVLNLKAAAVQGFKACYQIDGETPVVQEFSNVSLQGGQIQRVTFTQKPNLGAGDHRLRFWVDKEGDNNQNNDTTVCYIKAGNAALAGLPADYRFTETEPYGWTLRSDSSFAQPVWRFVKENGYNRPYISTNRNNNIKNNEYAASPLFAFKKDSVYRIEFSYGAVLAEGAEMGDLSLELKVCHDAGESAVFSSSDIIWKQDRFEDRSERKVVLYYKAKEDASRLLAFHAYGPSFQGGLRIYYLSVEQAGSNRLDYFYDFDGTLNENSQYLLTQNLDFVDYDGHITTGSRQARGWELCNETSSGYYSAYAAKATGLKGKANEWMVFRPFFLEKGQTYYLKFRKKMSASGNNGALEYYIQNNGPRMDLDYAQQPGIKGEATVSGSYDLLSRSFEVDESGYYILSIRNVTTVDDLLDEEESALRFSVFVDNVSLSATERNSVQVEEAEVPFEARLGRQVSLRTQVRNYSNLEIAQGTYRFCYQIDEQEPCRETSTFQLHAEQKTEYTYTTQASFSKEGTQTVKFWVEMDNATETPDTVRVVVNKIQVNSLPFVEKFEEKSMDEWQSYPFSRRVWQMQHGQGTAHSGNWAAKCDASGMDISDFLVTPLLEVEKDKTYRVSFYCKRGSAEGGANDSLSLYYAYDRYDNTGFRNKISVFRQLTSTEYDFCQTYVRFPNSGTVFLGLKADMKQNSPALYIDDFIMVDSSLARLTYYTLSNLVVSGNMSECDTASNGRLSFRITAGGYSMPARVPAYICYDKGNPIDVSFNKEMVDEEDLDLSFDMPLFSGGSHDVKVWIGLPDEANRTDDTLKASFSVRAPQVLPFRANEIVLGAQPRMTACFEVDDPCNYTLRLYYRAVGAGESALGMNLLHYAQNSIERAVPIAQITSFSTQFFEKTIEISEAGIYAIGFESRNLSPDGLFNIDSLLFEKVTDTLVAAPEFSIPGGTVNKGTPLSLSSTTPNTRIYYTTDLSDPTAGGTEYSAPIVINEDVTVKAVAVLGERKSGISMASYTVRKDTAAVDVFSPDEFFVTPNPASDHAEVRLPKEARELALIDMRGRVCRYFVVRGQQSIMIPLQDLPAGVYVVRAAGEHRQGMLKLIKQ